MLKIIRKFITTTKFINKNHIMTIFCLYIMIIEKINF